MHDEMITGKIFFSRVPLERECEDFIAFLVRCAVDNQIWINAGEQIKNPDARYKYSMDSGEIIDLSKKYLPFEITDNKDTDECDRITSGMWYRGTDFGIADWGSSGIPNIENFLVQIMECDLIRYVRISIDLAHGYIPCAYENLDINASDFCKTLMSLPNHYGLPTGQFNIKKSGDILS